MATLFLLMGLPAAGKTTLAKQLAVAHGAQRLSPDEWMIPLFGESEAGGKRDVLEGRMISVALQLLCLGTSVVLDFGSWARDERPALRWLAERAGATFQLAYVPVDGITQLERIERRWREAPHSTFPITVNDLDRWRGQFETPNREELAGAHSDAPTGHWPDWLSWAEDRRCRDIG